jgi:hypothetical protein
MATVTETTTPRKPAIAYYGWLHDQHGVFLQVDGAVSFRNDETHTWQPVDLETLTTWATLNGRLDLADTQLLADGDRVYRCSRTLTAVGR